MIPRLQEKYKGEIRKKLERLDKYSNVNQIPKIEKVIVHMGVSPQSVSYTHLTLPTILRV